MYYETRRTWISWYRSTEITIRDKTWILICARCSRAFVLGLQLSISLRFVGTTTSLNENDHNMVSIQSYVAPWIWYVFELVKSLFFMAFPCFWSNLGWFGWGSRRSGHKGMHVVLSRSFSNSWIVHIDKKIQQKESLSLLHDIRSIFVPTEQRDPSKWSLLARTPTQKLASNHNKRARARPKMLALPQTVNAL